MCKYALRQTTETLLMSGISLMFGTWARGAPEGDVKAEFYKISFFFMIFFYSIGEVNFVASESIWQTRPSLLPIRLYSLWDT